MVAERIRNNVGEKNTHDIVAEFVLEIVKNKGIVCDTINPRTIKNYMAYISTFPGVSLVDNSIPKTNYRWTAEHSDIAIIAIHPTRCKPRTLVLKHLLQWQIFYTSGLSHDFKSILTRG